MISYGRIVNNSSKYSREYFLRDHLGNTRVVFDENGEILQDVSYYPYGMEIGGLSHTAASMKPENKILFNGKEKQDDFGLDWTMYEFRSYDAAIARWHVQDPIKTYSESPYCFVHCNPMRFYDVKGMIPDEESMRQSGFYYDGYDWVYMSTWDVMMNNIHNRHNNIYGNNFQQEQQDVNSLDYLMLKLIWHYQFGEGKDFYIDISTLDFSRITQEDLGIQDMENNDEKGVQLFDRKVLFNKNTYSMALSIGKVNFVYLGDNKYRIKDDIFDFDYQPNGSFKRNVFTFIGGLLFGQIYNDAFTPIGSLRNEFTGGPFKIIFEGEVTIYPKY